MTPHRAFTLIELVVTIAVVGILMAIAAPSFQNMMNRNRATSDANSLVALLTLARSEAIKRNALVVICKSTDGVQCSTTAGDTWDKGALVFVDNGDGGGTAADQLINGTEALIRTEFPLSTGSTISGDTNVRNRVIYNAAGGLGTSSGFNGSNNGTFTIVPSGQTSETKRVALSVNGRASAS